ncbi:MAG: ATP-binding cassette domain-containing protein, partial [Anaeroglobus sp.]
MLELKHIYFAYDIGSPYVLKDINLQVHDGDYISVVGENGSGKSTLIKILLALVEPTSGTVENSFSRISYV